MPKISEMKMQDPTLQRAVAIAQEIHSPGFSLSYLQTYIREWERVTAMFREAGYGRKRGGADEDI